MPCEGMGKVSETVTDLFLSLSLCKNSFYLISVQHELEYFLQGINKQLQRVNEAVDYLGKLFKATQENKTLQRRGSQYMKQTQLQQVILNNHQTTLGNRDKHRDDDDVDLKTKGKGRDTTDHRNTGCNGRGNNSNNNSSSSKRTICGRISSQGYCPNFKWMIIHACVCVHVCVLVL